MIRRKLASTVVAVSLLVTVSACGDSPDTPGEAVPVLAERLSTVDTALQHGDYDKARQALASIVSATERARSAGKLSESSADRILAAVARLVTTLPEPQPPAATPPSPTAEPNDEHKDDEKKDDEKKDEDGDGHNSDNGPDDGHGN